MGLNSRPTTQLYAAAGYVVVYGNPRGSTGYGAEFADNNRSRLIQVGDYDDLMDVVDADDWHGVC